jgi:hypothetical protein
MRGFPTQIDLVPFVSIVPGEHVRNRSRSFVVKILASIHMVAFDSARLCPLLSGATSTHRLVFSQTQVGATRNGDPVAILLFHMFGRHVLARSSFCHPHPEGDDPNNSRSRNPPTIQKANPTPVKIPATFRIATRSPWRAITPSRRAEPCRLLVIEEKVSRLESMTCWSRALS